MYDDGYENIVNIDVSRFFMRSESITNTLPLQYSSICIEQMRQRHSESRPKMECTHIFRNSNEIPITSFSTGHEMDIRDLKFGDSTFDVVIDKGLSPLPGQSECTISNRDPSTNRNNGRDDDF